MCFQCVFHTIFLYHNHVVRFDREGLEWLEKLPKALYISAAFAKDGNAANKR